MKYDERTVSLNFQILLLQFSAILHVTMCHDYTAQTLTPFEECHLDATPFSCTTLEIIQTQQM